jgi:hypothetical protein
MREPELLADSNLAKDAERRQQNSRHNPDEVHTGRLWIPYAEFLGRFS